MSSQNSVSQNECVVAGRIKVDLAAHRVWIHGEECPATPLIFKLLSYFLKNPRRLISHQELLDNVWAPRRVESTAIKRSIADLRRLIGDEDPNHSLIRTVPREGYVLEASPAPVATRMNSSPQASRSRAAMPLLIGIAGALIVILGFSGLLGPAEPVVQAIAVAAGSDSDDPDEARRFAERLKRSLFLEPGWRVIDSEYRRGGWLPESPRIPEERAKLLLRTHGSQYAILIAHAEGADGSTHLRAHVHSFGGIDHQLESRGNTYDAAADALLRQVLTIVPVSDKTGGGPSNTTESYDTGAVIDHMVAGQMMDAVQILEKRLADAPADPWALSMLAQAQLSLRNPEAVRSAATKILSANPDPHLAIDAHRLLADAATMQGDFDSAAKHLRQAKSVSEEGGDKTATGKIHLSSARVAERSGAMDLAGSEYMLASQAFSDSGSEVDLMVAQVNYASFLERIGKASEAVTHFQSSLDRAEEFGLGNATRVISANLSLALRKTGLWKEARRHVERALELAIRDDLIPPQAIYRLTQAILATDEGQLDEADGYLKRALAIAEAGGEPRILAGIYGMQGTVALERLDLEAADGYFEAALAHTVEGSARDADIRIIQTAARCVSGKTSTPNEGLEELKQSAAQRGLQRELVAAIFAEARYCAASPLESVTLLEQGLEEADQLGEPALIALLRSELAYFLLQVGDVDRASVELSRALRWKADYPEALAVRALLAHSQGASREDATWKLAQAAIGQRVLWQTRMALANETSQVRSMAASDGT